MNRISRLSRSAIAGLLLAMGALPLSAATTEAIEAWQDPAVFARNRLPMRTDFKTDAPDRSLAARGNSRG